MKKAVVVLVSLMVVACNSTPSKNVSAADKQNNTQAAAASADQGKAAANDLVDKGIYFELNKAVVASSYSPLIQKEAEYIKSRKNELVTLEGNCDERGSDEYNLALGQRRADAVKKLLVAAGVHAHQVKTTSLGKEKPKATCHDERCWKENRRVDFVQS